jgi:hypothetical protein
MLFPWMSISGFPGNRLELYREGIIPINFMNTLMFLRKFSTNVYIMT